MVRIAYLAALCACTYTPSQYRVHAPPVAAPMIASRVLGTWQSTFGDVRMAQDPLRGGLEMGAVRGEWAYSRDDAVVRGFFDGTLRGNVLRLTWVEEGEMGEEPLSGDGYLVFLPQGTEFAGWWWSSDRDRTGDWHGWR